MIDLCNSTFLFVNSVKRGTSTFVFLSLLITSLVIAIVRSLVINFDTAKIE